jgi:hypothetical protein
MPISIPFTIKTQAVECLNNFQTVYEREIWCLCTFGQKSSKLNSRPVYGSRLYVIYKMKIFFVNYTSMTWILKNLKNLKVSRGSEMSRGPNESGPKWVGAQMCWGPKESGPKWVGAQMSQGPKWGMGPNVSQPKICDWAKCYNRHRSENIWVTVLLAKWCTPRGIIWAKGQLAHSYTFWIMLIMIFSLVANFGDHPLKRKEVIISAKVVNYGRCL